MKGAMHLFPAAACAIALNLAALEAELATVVTCLLLAGVLAGTAALASRRRK